MKLITLLLSSYYFGALFTGASAESSFEGLLRAEEERNPNHLAVVESLESKHAVRRARAAITLGRIQKPEALYSLGELLKDKSLTVRNEAAFALGQLLVGGLLSAEQEKEAQILLVKKIEEEGPSGYLLEALGKYSHPILTVPVLGRFVSHSDPLIVNAALIGIFRTRYFFKLRNPALPYPELEDSFFVTLEGLIHRSELKNALVYLLFRLGDRRGFDLLKNFTQDPSAYVRLYAWMGLTKILTPGLEDLAVSALRDKNPNVRFAVVKYLAQSKVFEKIYQPGNGLVSDPSFHVRSLVAEVLVSEPLAESWLIDRIENDPSPSVRAAALRSLAGQKSAHALRYIDDLYSQKSFVLRLAAVDALKVLEPGAKDRFLKMQLDPDIHVRVAALEAIGKMDGVQAFEVLQRSLQSEELSERATAVGLLLERQESQVLRLAFETYLKSLSRKWTELREILVDYLILQKDSDTTAFLEKVISQEASLGIARKIQAELKDRGLTQLPGLPPVTWVGTPYWRSRYLSHPIAEVQTTKGKFLVEFYSEDAPIHVANIVGQINRGFYNGLLWHRVVSNFVVQGGDPDGTGWGDDGYSLRAEINSRKFGRGTLGMPRSQDFDTGGVQMFFTHLPTPHLDAQYTVFGQVIEGLSVIDALEVGDKILKMKMIIELSAAHP